MEPTKVCPRCERRKPWSAFCVRTRWPDGTTRVPQSWCKDCHRARTPDPKVRAKANRKYWSKFAGDGEAYTDHLERRRFRYHIERGTIAAPRPAGEAAGGVVPIGPFASWLRSLGEFGDAARMTGLTERQAGRYRREEQGAVSIDVVDRALLAAGTAYTLDDLYPESEAA